MVQTPSRARLLAAIRAHFGAEEEAGEESAAATE